MTRLKKNCHEDPGIIRTITTTIHNVMSIKITVLRFTTLEQFKKETII